MLVPGLALLGRDVVSCLTIAMAVLIAGCGTPTPSVQPTSSPAPPSSVAVCIDQQRWEPHEGAFTGHWEAAQAAAKADDTAKGNAEALLAASEAAAMAAEARGINPGVAGDLQRSVDSLIVAAAAFRVGDFTAATSRLLAADEAHQHALGSVTVADWCPVE